MVGLLCLLLIAGIAILPGIISNFKKKWASTVYDKTIIELYEAGELIHPWRFEPVCKQADDYWCVLFFLEKNVVPIMGFKDVGHLVHKWDGIWEQQWLAVQEKILQYSEQNRKLLKRMGLATGIKNDVDFCRLLKKLSKLRYIATPIEKQSLQYDEKTLADFYDFTFLRCLANGQPLHGFNSKGLTQAEAKDALDCYRQKWGNKYYSKLDAAASEFSTYKGAFDFSAFLIEICTIKQWDWESIENPNDAVLILEEDMLFFVETKSIVMDSPNVVTFRLRGDYTPTSKYGIISTQKFKGTYTDKWEKVSYGIEVCSINCKEKTFLVKEYSIFTYDGELLDSGSGNQKPQQILCDNPYSSLNKVYAYVMNHIKKTTKAESKNDV